MIITGDIEDAIRALPKKAWPPAYDSDRSPRDGAWVAELTGMLRLGRLAEGHPRHRPQGAARQPGT